ncbi:acetyltransferase [Teratosphaeria destructans]|uniref:Acetyltransferase n=1 Tax=Teratosphaeria destructans TaxID=418781 RepID=A0A9W7W5I3_9PEZI|nr:acetyltransferase [Teratosphaeria destructans]
MEIQPLQETAIPASVDVELEAFRSHPRMPMLYPRGYTPDLYAFYTRQKTQKFHDSDVRVFKVVDPKTGKMVACSEWNFALDPKKASESIVIDPDEPPPPNYPEGGNWAITRFSKNEWEKWRHITLTGKPYISLSHSLRTSPRSRPNASPALDLLLVHPAFQGRGAATHLLSWGCARADGSGVPIVLESTPAGLSLYRRFGFTQVKVVAADMQQQFGWHEPYDEEAAKRFWMVREPRQRHHSGMTAVH